MCDVKWVRLDVGMPDSPKIKYLRHLPNGDKLVVLWIWLLILAGKCNAGGRIFVTEGVPYNRAILSYVLDTDVKTLNIALENFSQLNMISIDGDIITITNWEEYQNTDGMDRIREQAKARKQRQRERDSHAEKGNMSRDSHVTVTENVTPCHATEKEIEEDIDIKETSTNVEVKKKTAPRFSPPTLEEIRAYCSERENGIDPETFFDYYTANGWMAGKNHMKDWKATVRNWERKDFRKPGKLQPPQSISPSGTSETLMEDLSFIQSYLNKEE